MNTHQTTSPRIWKGPSLLAISALHTAIALLLFRPVLYEMLERGIFNTVGDDPMRGAVVWFVFFGAVLALFGLAVTMLERNAPQVSQRSLGAGLLALAVLGVALMPVSGFWLAFPIAVAMLRKPTQATASSQQKRGTP